MGQSRVMFLNILHSNLLRGIDREVAKLLAGRPGKGGRYCHAML
jgi:hypothetical protein